jgi:hypothetical protein
MNKTRVHLSQSANRLFRFALLLALLSSILLVGSSSALASQTGLPVNPGPDEPLISGPFVSEGEIWPYDFTGDLRDLPQEAADPFYEPPPPMKYVPGTEPKGPSQTIADWEDPLAQNFEGPGWMPAPGISFNGMNKASNGNGWPPDTNGDVGPDHYIQSVNTSLAIYNKTTGALITAPTFNTFFTGTGTPCDTSNSGDPVVVYDRFEDRWVVTDFYVGDPYYECIAISKNGDPVSGGWWMYGVQISSTSMNDYPKVGVWRDGYYFSFNMFAEPNDDWDGVQVWAFEKTPMLSGGAIKSVKFLLSGASGYGSLLPSHALSLPPVGAPNYFASVAPPDRFQIWEFLPNWTTPPASTFTGPTELTVAEFAIAASVPQRNSSILLDSLSFRPMMQLIYREVNGNQAIWLNHTVASQGVAGVRWYEVRDPGGSPQIYQQGTYQPDTKHRWMGSLAVDMDGNMAVGYSVSSATMYPAIRYAGRLAGETPGLLPQAEATLYQGNGSQTSTTRWGDYSAMSIDPDDDCTFWYTTEYYSVTGTNWQTRIGSFKFPSCGQPKGTLQGSVLNAITLEPVAGVSVTGTSITQTLTTVTDENGFFSMAVAPGDFSLSAGPMQPAYPTPASASNLTVIQSAATTQDLYLAPVPNLVEMDISIDDNVLMGNNNTFPEPKESGLILWETIENTGAITSTVSSAILESLTPGVFIHQANAAYPQIAAGQNQLNQTPYLFSIDQSVPCGSDIAFRKTVIDQYTTYLLDFKLNAAIPYPFEDVFNDTVEGGNLGWTSSGTNNTWGITTSAAYSPSHSWTDSPSASYLNNTDSALRSPAFNLSGKRNIRISGWSRYSLEAGYDFIYLEYSLNGGSTWSGTGAALEVFNGYQNDWQMFSLDAPQLTNQPNVALRFHFISDGGVTDDGFYFDNFSISYEPYDCLYSPVGMNYLGYIVGGN